jgi:hypothetical protein
MRRWSVTAAVLLGAAALARGEDARPAWTVAAEAGYGRIHDDDSAPAGALRVFRRLGRSDVLRVELGAAVSSYAAIDAGIEARLCPSWRVSPVLGVGGGPMLEDEYGGGFFRASAGVEAVLARNLVLRAVAQAGVHDGQAGPHLATVGVGWRF